MDIPELEVNNDMTIAFRATLYEKMCDYHKNCCKKMYHSINNGKFFHQTYFLLKDINLGGLGQNSFYLIFLDIFMLHVNLAIRQNK